MVFTAGAALACIVVIGTLIALALTSLPAELLLVNPYPFAVAVMVAASAAFMTPIGYQTNLMIYGPGGYRFADFVRFGAPLSLLWGAGAVWIILQVWPF